MKGTVMLYRKNLPGWERAMRTIGGVVMVACGLLGLSGMPIGYLIAGAGLVTALTGFVGFCPMCAMVGRKLSA
jgi:Inner membrane protein YgaP-like, transmembrane domain